MEERNDSAALVEALMGTAFAVTVAFVILRLCGVIRWGWWVVLSPV